MPVRTHVRVFNALLVLAAPLILGSAPVASAKTLAARPAAPSALTPLQREADAFLNQYGSLYQRLTAVASEAEWAASTDVSDKNEGRRTAAGQMFAAFRGDKQVIATTKALLARKAELTPLQVRQLDSILLRAGSAPGTIPDVVNARIEAESRQASVQDGFSFCLAAQAAAGTGLAKDGTCAKASVVTANDIDGELRTSKDLARRLQVWTAAKEIGRPLKAGLTELQKLRNQVAREMGYSSFFGLQVADYGMSVAEMMALLDGFVNDTKPLYTAMHAWTARELGKRYGQPAPKGPIPAHWFTNRWAQNWTGIAPGVDLDNYFEGRKPEWITEQAEKFYVSMGFPSLPKSFWDKSDLYPIAVGQRFQNGQETAARKKNSHASAWHMDLDNDVRSLMSVKPDSKWFSTAHHELGHIYYYIAYSRPEVPHTLREGANRAFHEGIGELISIASGQVPYLKQQGILPPDVTINTTEYLLNEALEHTVAFIPWSAGVMSRFEHDVYEKNLPPAQWQARWWELVAQYQGVVPPDAARIKDPALCDACTKTHVNDDPAQYYDYAIATVIKYQLHEHIATKILKQDPHSCNYYGSKEVGTFLRNILQQGATRDWREVLKEATGEPLSTRAMIKYFAPLQVWLAAENAKAK